LNRVHLKPLNKVFSQVLRRVVKHKGGVFGGLIGLISSLLI